MLLLSLFVAGGIGALSRHLVDQWMVAAGWTIGSFPLPTFAINVMGSFLAALVFFGWTTLSFSEEWKTVIIVGYLGGFTTFSAYALQCVRLTGDAHSQTALVYFLLTPSMCVAAALLGRWLALKGST